MKKLGNLQYYTDFYSSNSSTFCHTHDEVNKEALIQGMPEKLHELAKRLNETSHIALLEPNIA